MHGIRGPRILGGGADRNAALDKNGRRRPPQLECVPATGATFVVRGDSQARQPRPRSLLVLHVPANLVNALTTGHVPDVLASKTPSTGYNPRRCR